MVGLPFKRTRKPPPTSVQEDVPTPVKDNPLDIFQLRQDDKWFTEQEKKAAEKAAEQEKARRERLAKEDTNMIEEQLSRESSEHQAVSAKKKGKATARRGSKRQHTISSDEDDDPKFTSPASRKSSRLDTSSPSRSRDSVKAKSTPLSSRQSRRSRPKSSIPPTADIISLDDSDDNDYTRTPTKSKGKEKLTVLSDDDLTKSAPAHQESDDDDIVEVGAGLPPLPPPADDDVGAEYIRAAQERAKKRREEQEAREARESQDVAAVEILITSRLEGIPNLKIKIQINKKITLVRDAWQASTKRRLEGTNSTIRGSTVDSMFLTWKGGKIFDFYTLERLGIKPDSRGNLLPTSRGTEEGFAGWDKVHFEAWTADLYLEEQARRERERRRNLGELDDEPDEAPVLQSQTEAEKKIKIILRSRNYEEQRRSVGLKYTIGMVVKAFRKSAEIPSDKTVEIHLDGEILEEDTTIDDSGLEDMDVLEVHVKDS